MKLWVFISLILSIIFNVSCSLSNKNYLVFSSNDTTTIENNHTLTIHPKDIVYAEKKKGIDPEPMVIMHLNKDAISKISKFTEKLVGKNLTIKFNDIVIYKEIPVNSKITSDVVLMPVSNDFIADEIVEKYNYRLR